MSWKTRDERPASPTGTYCPTCQESLPPWPIGQAVVHCDGRSAAFTRVQWKNRIHHGHRENPPCWHCGAPLGCDKCTGPITETLCTHCVAWATREAFLAHGPILDTEVMRHRRGGSRAMTLAEYPAEWQLPYRRLVAQDTPHPISPKAADVLATAGLPRPPAAASRR